MLLGMLVWKLRRRAGPANSVCSSVHSGRANVSPARGRGPSGQLTPGLTLRSGSVVPWLRRRTRTAPACERQIIKEADTEPSLWLQHVP